MLSSSLLSCLVLAPVAVLGFSFSVTNTPTQCEALDISWSGGTPPYEVTIVPIYSVAYFPTVWNITVIDVNTTSTSWSGTLPYPAGSNFVVVLSDETGFGSGGTTPLLTVANSSDTSCNPPSALANVTAALSNIRTTFAQCQSVSLAIVGIISPPATISAVVPGGPSLMLDPPELAFWTPVATGYQLSWTVDMPVGMQAIFLAGDQTGRASALWTGLYTIGNSTNTTCLADSPFLATEATTSTSSTSHVGAIVGGVIGALAALAVLTFLVMFIIRRRNISRRRLSTQEKAAGLRMYPLDGFSRNEVPKGQFGSE